MRATSRLGVVPAMLLLLFMTSPAGARPVPVRALTTLTFSVQQLHVIGGSAQDRPVMYPRHPVTCHKTNTANTLHDARWHCHAHSALYSALLHIHHARVRGPMPDAYADPQALVLAFELDYTLFAVFLLGFLGTALCGVCIAAAMYLAVARMMSFHVKNVAERCKLHCEKQAAMKEGTGEVEPLHPRIYERSKPVDVTGGLSDEYQLSKQPGYGSFGRKLHVIGNFSGSFSSVMDDFSPLPSPPASPVGSHSVEMGQAERRLAERKERLDLLQGELYLG